MRSQAVTESVRETFENLVLIIPFFKQLRALDEAQYERLLSYSFISSYDHKELVLAQGSNDLRLYCVLKGKLDVMVNDQVVNHLTPGEVFGDLSLLMKKPKATNVVTSSSNGAVVFVTNFGIFGALEDFSQITLQTKLCYYRNLSHSLRWKLEVYRSEHPNEPLSSRPRGQGLFKGDKDSVQELRWLHEECLVLSDLLLSWNGFFSATQKQDVAAIDPS